jgi:hypothetical protein
MKNMRKEKMKSQKRMDSKAKGRKKGKVALQKYKIFLTCLVFMVIALLACKRTVLAESIVICPDTSGSMRIDGRIEAAKEAVIKEIEKAKPGDKIWVVTFDTYARLLGKLEVVEGGATEEAKQELIKKISEIKAIGPWTHLEQAVMKAKTILLDEREIAGAKILIFSDGLSDPDPRSGVAPVNLEEIATLLPQKLGINIYIISFKEDISGFFRTPVKDSGLVINPSAPHIKGVPITSFSPEKIESAIKETRKADSKEISIPQKKSTERSKRKELLKIEKRMNSKILYAGFLGIGILAIFALFAIFAQKKKKEIFHFTLETEMGDEKQEFEIDLPEGKKKSVGSSGDVQVPTLEDLPPILFSLQRKKGQTWLIPQDAISLNGLQLTGITQVNSGDVIGIRNSLMFKISERREESE